MRHLAIVAALVLGGRQVSADQGAPPQPHGYGAVNGGRDSKAFGRGGR